MSVFCTFRGFACTESVVLSAEMLPPVASVDWSRKAEPDELPEASLGFLGSFRRSARLIFFPLEWKFDFGTKLRADLNVVLFD